MIPGKELIKEDVRNLNQLSLREEAGSSGSNFDPREPANSKQPQPATIKKAMADLHHNKSNGNMSVRGEHGTILVEDVSKLILSRSMDDSMQVDLDYDFIFQCLTFIKQRKIGDSKCKVLSTEDLLLMIESSDRSASNPANQFD